MMDYLYKDMNCRIKIGNVITTQVESILIKGSIRELADTCEITLPRNYKLDVQGRPEQTEERNIRDFIKEGDPVEVYLGYDGKEAIEFRGYLEQIGAGTPLKLSCVDEMYKLQRGTLTKTFTSTTLVQLLEYIAPGYSYQVIDNLSLGKFIINNSTAYHVLEALRKDYLLYSYFQGDILYVGFMTDITTDTEHTYHLQRNVRQKGTKLEFVSKRDEKLLVKAISNNRDGSKIVKEYGEHGGSTRTVNYYNKTASELSKLAENQHNTLSFDGFEGTIAAWGEPRCRAGDVISIIDTSVPNSQHNGRYIAEEVTIKFNASAGFIRKIKPSIKL